MNDTLIFGAGAVPAIIGLVEVIKDLGLPSKFAPAAAVLLGIFFGQLQLAAGHQPWAAALATGITLGLSAVGLHAGVTTIVPGSNQPVPAPSNQPDPAPSNPVAPAPSIPGPRRTRRSVPVAPIVPPAPPPEPPVAK